jgi:hypothetical protein
LTNSRGVRDDCATTQRFTLRSPRIRRVRRENRHLGNLGGGNAENITQKEGFHAFYPLVQQSSRLIPNYGMIFL